MDPASQALAQHLPLNVCRTYAALADHSDGRQYLTPLEEKAFVQHILQTATLRFPLRIKDIPALAFSIARQRSATKVIKPLNKN
ncbi:hypothetical protein K458DRAFT_454139 [Lentithecium fluviatile CBS 122367]|uniref:Uncharacterized protein n=1 Tax=Lentithecium fluviatile CBS 122367 TaxID=1168545 RepID=A0A6G1IVP0_9PLEO|nr:hypothetical protein K458DRAFT_454139 [Lentithecium fluviatile CBS 122367]